ncbi:MAG: single-stranded-DNA-specific exonuclease RecJ [Acidobacteria bacterium]|nr:single-stranded-DNA-specific exonuclease RecJ [Acidobacteriota bacterium]MYD69884.1 single-stranded-DNA-specific exonuclease RecJ [Acidobacteriota bacterium]MYJ03760.1 single-stranded-DNA-specific exonuclease RecJ [Acidobacteriota bacterium]
MSKLSAAKGPSPGSSAVNNGGATNSESNATVWRHLPPGDRAAAKHIERELGIHATVARLLVQRGLADPAAAERFLHPGLDQLHDPSRLNDLDRAVDRLQQAIERREPIAIHGDYDADGVSATVMLRRVLELLGADVTHFIPERLTDGYGLQPDTIDRLKAGGRCVIVTVDCGIRSDAAAERARALGVDLIVTDHHEPGPTLPPALAVVNPRRADSVYPDRNLAGAGVAFKVAQALCQRTDRAAWLPALSKLAAIGTLADAVPLLGENRIIARIGLEQLSQGPNSVGLQALLETCGLAGEAIDSDAVAFRIAPRINAAGRMQSPELATRLLLATGDAASTDARQLAETLDNENTRRRAEETAIAAEARRTVENDPQLSAERLLVVWGEEWHRGVIGIVASKLVETFGRPAIVLSVDGAVAHGSGRSVPGFNLLGALESCADLFTRFGGHRQAAGMEIRSERLLTLRRRLAAYAAERIDPEALGPQLTVDAPLPLDAINSAFIHGLTAMEPFGQGNPRPVFCAERVDVVEGPRPLKERHLQMTVRQGAARFRAVAWRAAERIDRYTDRGDGINLAFSLSENRFRGSVYTELTVADAMPAR